MKNFNEGDRVTHPTHGEGTVIDPYDGTDWPTVKFDGGPKMMTHNSFLTPVPAPFRNGDRVTHPLHGSAGVLQYDAARKLVEIVPNAYGGNSTHVHPSSLTLETQGGKFKIGDRVSHPIHRNGTVEEISVYSGLHTVNIGGGRVYMALEHQIELAKPEPKFNLTVTDTEGWSSTVGPHGKPQIDALLADGFNWDTVESITVTRQKG